MSRSEAKSTPSSTNSIFNRIRNFRIHLDTSTASISPDSQNGDDNIVMNLNQKQHNKKTRIHDETKSNNSNNINHHKHRHNNNIEIPLTPCTPSTISSTNVLQFNTEQSRHTKSEEKKQHLQIPTSSSSSNMSISSPSSFQNVFEKLQSFRVSLDDTSPLNRTNQGSKTQNDIFEIESLNASLPSLLQPQHTTLTDDDLKLNINASTNRKRNHLTFASPQIIANIPSHSNQNKSKIDTRKSQIIAHIPSHSNNNKSKSPTRKSQIVDLKDFLSLPSPPKDSKYRRKKHKKYDVKQQILPFHERYKSQMKHIFGIGSEKNANNNDSGHSLPHYYYTSPSVISDAPTIPSHLLLQFPNNNNENESLQDAYKRHRRSIDLNKKQNNTNKKYHKKVCKKKVCTKKANLSKKKQFSVKNDELCPCSCHDKQNNSNATSPSPMYPVPVSYDGDIEDDEKKENAVIESNIGVEDTNKKKKKKKKIIMAPPIAVTVKMAKPNTGHGHGISDLDSECILNERKDISSSLSISGGIIQDLVRLSSISPSPVWYNNRQKLHIKEIRNYCREYMVISSVCCALWSQYGLEILKLFKLSWSQRIMAFAEPSVMFYVIDINKNSKKNTPKQLFNIAENRFDGLEYIELKYRLNCEKHKFALMCIVDSYYIINETDQYFIDQKHCIPSYLIRNKNSILA